MSQTGNQGQQGQQSQAGVQTGQRQRQSEERPGAGGVRG